MNRLIRTYAIAAGTVLGWVAMVVDVLPWGPDLADDVSRLALVMAGCGSCVLAIRSKTRPALEMYEVGHESGYRQGRIDAVTEGAKQAVILPFNRRASS